MPKKLIKRFLPHPDTIKKNRFLSIFGKVIHAYFVGIWTLGLDTQSNGFELSWQWISNNSGPFLLGCFICGIVSALIGYFGIRLFWRYHVINAWNVRRAKRKTKLMNG